MYYSVLGSVMKLLEIEYNHEFISNKIRDELLLYDIWNFKQLEKQIIAKIDMLFSFNIGLNRNINYLSGGQRSITYLVTLSYILKERNISEIELSLQNILESLSIKSRNILQSHFKDSGILLKGALC